MKQNFKCNLKKNSRGPAFKRKGLVYKIKGKTAILWVLTLVYLSTCYEKPSYCECWHLHVYLSTRYGETPKLWMLTLVYLSTCYGKTAKLWMLTLVYLSTCYGKPPNCECWHLCTFLCVIYLKARTDNHSPTPPLSLLSPLLFTLGVGCGGGGLCQLLITRVRSWLQFHTQEWGWKRI